MPGDIRGDTRGDIRVPGDKRPSTSSADEDFISLEQKPSKHKRDKIYMTNNDRKFLYIPISPLMAAEAAAQRAMSESRTEASTEIDADPMNDSSSSHQSNNSELRSESPWCREKGYTADAIGLHFEIRDFYEFISPTPEEQRMRDQVVGKVTDVIVQLWPNAKVEVFGSYKTGLYLPMSDIDLVVFGKWDNLPLRTLEKAFITADIADASGIQVIDKASVPIIKIVDKATEVRVDISFNMANSVHAVQLVRNYHRKFPTLKYLVLILKQFLNQRDLNEVYFGGVSSYSIVLMTISFLQLHPRPDARRPQANLGVLLLEFFELYGLHFNYNNVCIRVKRGGSYLPKSEFYRKEVGARCPDKGLCIEDPYTQGNDISRGSYHSDMVAVAFEKALYSLRFAMFPDPSAKGPLSLRLKKARRKTPSLLLNIIQLSPELVAYRKWIRTNF